MFGVSFLELLVIMGVLLLVFGPEKLPELARKLGKASAELKRHSDAMRREFYNSVYLPADDLKTQLGKEFRQLDGLSPSSPASLDKASTPQPSDQSAAPAAANGPEGKKDVSTS